YGLPEKMNAIRGKIDMHQKGFAFLIPDEEDMQDVYIHAFDLHSAMNRDTVLVRLEKQGDDGQRPEGSVIRIVERANQQIVGTFEDNQSNNRPFRTLAIVSLFLQTMANVRKGLLFVLWSGLTNKLWERLKITNRLDLSVRMISGFRMISLFRSVKQKAL